MTETRFYGFSNVLREVSAFDAALEELSLTGYVVLENALPKQLLEQLQTELDGLRAKQKSQSDFQKLAEVGERDLIRCPFAASSACLELARFAPALKLIRALMGEYVVLNQQNAIFNEPEQEHAQGAWHRDLPYQEYSVSKPLAMSMLTVIDKFTKETGGTMVVPGSHRFETVPSEQFVKAHEVCVEAQPGSLVLFDSFLIHRAGNNTSSRLRRAVNTMYARPIIKQQFDIPVLLGGRYSDDPELRKLLGYEARVPTSVEEWNRSRFEKR